MATDDEMARILDRTDVVKATLWRRMQQRHLERYGKKLRKISIRLRPVLKPEVKAKRVEKANDWLGQDKGKQWLRRVVWIDEKQEDLRCGGSYRCYAPHDMKSFQREDLDNLPKKFKVKYEAAVSAVLGPVYFNFISGTTGKPKKYKARTLVPPPADHRLACWGPCLPRSVNGLHLLAGILATDAQRVVA